VKTTVPKESEIKRVWHLVDAEGKPLGRLAVQIANLLRGKGKAIFSRQVDTGDFVVVVNAAKVKLTGRKEEQKRYKRFTGYRSGYNEVSAAFVRARHPERMIEQAVHGMLPHNHQSRTTIKRLKVYAGAEHPHGPQNPTAAKQDL
jgi:large subunit ribosomal protein L13